MAEAVVTKLGRYAGMAIMQLSKEDMVSQGSYSLDKSDDSKEEGLCTQVLRGR